LRETGQQFECFRFDVFSMRPGVSVGSSIMRDLPVGSLVREAVQRLVAARLREAERELEESSVRTVVGVAASGTPLELEPDEEFLRHHDAFWQKRADAYRKQLSKPSGKGRGRRYPPGHLEEVARVVRDARSLQDPVQARVAKFFDISLSAAANQISRARARGLLDPNDKKQEE